jgi:hypothetical protein
LGLLCTDVLPNMNFDINCQEAVETIFLLDAKALHNRLTTLAEVVKLVDTLDSGSSEQYAHRGSSPRSGTIN